MASPDTDELATVPLPAGTPEAEVPPRQDRTEVAPQQTEPLAAASGVASRAEPAGQGAAGAQQTEPLAVEPDQAQTVPQERVEPEQIEPPEAAAEPTEPAKPGGRWWRGLTGSLAAGLAVLAVGVLVVAGIDLNTGAPGPGAVLLIGHPVAAILALLAQRVADRRNGAPAAVAGVAVVLFTVSALTLFWLT